MIRKRRCGQEDEKGRGAAERECSEIGNSRQEDYSFCHMYVSFSVKIVILLVKQKIK